jgi:hypothetical protein
MLGSPFEPGRELQQLATRAGGTTMVGKFAEPTRYLSIMRTIKRWESRLRPAERKSLLNVWIPHEHHLQKIAPEICEGLPSAKAGLSPLSQQREAEEVVQNNTCDTAECA